MGLLYSLGICLYGFLLNLAALFNPKAKAWVKGRMGLFAALEHAFGSQGGDAGPVTWFHASSLGEFEQGRPVIEAWRKAFPADRILLTFFSPSGYLVRKNYPGADHVFYLPLDTPANARRLLGIVKPARAIFIKYDFWFNLLGALQREKIPVYFISVKFRPGQLFFRWYGSWFRRKLEAVTWFFAQNAESGDLLGKIGIPRCTVTGDTRFDRVFAIAAERQEFPAVKQFAGESLVFIMGSTWKEDEELLLKYMHHAEPGLKFIIAPHDTSPERIRYILERVKLPVARFSELTGDNAARARVLLVDSVGILAHLYQYATLAYIGGGFGSGIHNIQEPVTFGVPVLFGPKYEKFREAVDLVSTGGAIPVTTAAELENAANRILNDPDLHHRLSELCRSYVDENRGATALIMQYFLADRPRN